MTQRFPKIVILNFVIFFFLNTISFGSETGKIAGRVLDKNTKEPLIGANVMIVAVWENNEPIKLSNPIGAATDVDGRYFILNLRPGEYNIKCSMMGYKKQEITKVKVFIDKTSEVNFDLEIEPIQSEEVIITAFQPNRVERDLTATKQTYNTEEIEIIAGIKDVADILELQADVIDNHFRGGREGESLSLIGGANINNPLSSKRTFQPLVSGLKTVEVLTSGFSAEYGNAQSGVINMIPKEGGEKWSVRLNYELDLPHYQLWNGNPYSVDNMPFFKKLSQLNEWLTYYISDGNKKWLIREWSKYIPKSDHYSNITDSVLKTELMYNDSLSAAKMAMTSWLQMARRVGLENETSPFKRFEITAGGPVSNRIKFFIAASQTKEEPIVSVPIPDLNYQLMTNLSIQPSNNDKFIISYTYNYSFKNDVGKPTNWFDLVIGNPKTVQNINLGGLNWTHLFSQATFLDFAFQWLNTDEILRPEFMDPDRFVSTAYNGATAGTSTSNTYAGRYDNTPTGHRVNNVSLSRGSTKTNTYTINTSLSSQINSFNFLKSGLQFQYYDINVNEEYHLSTPGDMTYSRYRLFPYEGAIYLQDKMEFEGFVANIGLRLDFYNFNMKYFSNIFTPLFNPKYPEEGKARDENYALKENTKLNGRLAPRLGISFPVSENTVFHLNYGTFLQRPPFQYVLSSEMSARGNIIEIGNPRLKPEKTSAWDIGIVQALPEDFRLDISAYYKDVKDLIEQAVYVNSSNERYVNYTNRDYANIKGFNINLERFKGILNFYLRYNYQIAKGKASAPGGALVTIYETPLTDGSNIDLPDPRDILMDYDRTHRLIANIGINTDKETGPEIFGFRPLADFAISATFRFQSGQPYTYDEKLLGLIFNKRMPDSYELKMRIQKAIKIGDYRFLVYLEGYNLLNLKEFSSQVFTNKEYLLRYLNGERDSLIWYDGTYSENPNSAREIYQYSDADKIYRNQPRYFRFGIRAQL